MRVRNVFHRVPTATLQFVLTVIARGKIISITVRLIKKELLAKMAHKQVTMAVVFDYDDEFVSNEFMHNPEALSMWMKYGPEFMPLRMNGVHIRVAPLSTLN